MTIRFMSLASGSSGNCYYLGTEKYGLLVDAGIATRTLKKHLRDAGIPLEHIRAVFITHDHTDHIKGVANLGERLHIPVYATALTHRGIGRNYCMREPLTTSARVIEKGVPITLEDFTIEAFEVPHDGTDNVGYCIEGGGHTLVFMTDLGEVPPQAEAYVARADYLILESNYDPEMLQAGPYPFPLKQRITGPRGHLSNKAAADFLATHFPARLRHVWLCHLSRENNHPELAVKTMTIRLQEAGIVTGRDVEVTPLKRTTPSELYVLD